MNIFKTFMDNSPSKWWMLLLYISVFCLQSVTCEEYKTHSIYNAIVNVTYRDPATGKVKFEIEESGRYGTTSILESEHGLVVLVRTQQNKTDGCTPPVNVPEVKWIALIERGNCKFHKKIHYAAIVLNASAVVIFNHKEYNDLIAMDHKVKDVVNIFIRKRDGDHLLGLLDSGTRVYMHISVGRQQTNLYNNSINKTSVLNVSIPFIFLMIISLAWLDFYYF